LVASLFLGLGVTLNSFDVALVVPALGLAYVAGACAPPWRRLAHLGLGLGVAATVSLPWILAVDAVPRDARPYVASTMQDSELELLGLYNGLGRLTGHVPRTALPQPGAGQPGAGQPGAGLPSTGLPGAGLPGAGQPSAALPGAGQPSTGQLSTRQPSNRLPSAGQPSTGLASTGQPSAALPGAGQPSAGQPSNRLPSAGQPANGLLGGPQQAGPVVAEALLQAELGRPGPGRLFNATLGGQLSWFVPLAVIGLVVGVWRAGWGRPWGVRQAAVVLFGTWFVTEAMFFTTAAFFHRHYLVTMAPATAALFALGLAELWRAYRGPHPAGWLLGPAMLIGAVLQAQLVPYTLFDTGQRLTAAMVLGAGAAFLALFSLRLVAQRMRPATLAARVGFGVGVASLLLAPAAWTGMAVFDPYLSDLRGALPYAGPDEPGIWGSVPTTGFGFGGSKASIVRQTNAARSAEISYLLANRGQAKYLLLAGSAMLVEGEIVDSGRPALAVGGFGGTDPVLPEDQVERLITSGQVRFVRLGFPPGPGRPPQEPPSLRTWTMSHCRPVRPSAASPLVLGLFDCATAQPA
jgi:4-amino-4-deoxy-L-arabinose transferase-like glycosyltransferase